MAQGENMTKTTQQICKECGKVFMRSLYHPQIVTCSTCRSIQKHDCVKCPYSEKVVWDLICKKTGKVVTDGGFCGR